MGVVSILRVSMFIRVIRILTPIFLITLVAIALIFIPFEANSDAMMSETSTASADLPEGTFP